MKTVIFVLFIVIAGCARKEPPSEIIYPERPIPYHVVKQGDTNESVAKQYSMDVEEFKKINKIRGDILIPGQRLFIHVRQSTKTKSEEDVHVQPLEIEKTSEKIADTTPKLKTDRIISDKPLNTEKISYDWPVSGKIIKKFGDRLSDGSLNDGIHIQAPSNVPVRAIAEGRVKEAGSPLPAYGNMVILEHKDGKISIYAHLKEISIKNNKKGKIVYVSKGDIIGRVGKTGAVGAANTPQLYLQIRNAKLAPMDPLKVLPKNNN
ncbi:MAG: peptidoglycan DD-metalloendopeptidase family protein [Alphaproteobacteria bacterium]